MTPSLRARLADLYQSGRYQEALALIVEALQQCDSSECWNDWAALQFRLNRREEAEAGFRVAIEKDPTNLQAVLNLGTLLLSSGNYPEAHALLKQASESKNEETSSSAARLLTSLPQSQLPTSREIEVYLRRFVSESANERSYFDTHIRRYTATIQMLPVGKPGARLLELGAAFHHVTPAVAKFSRYETIRCNDLWVGERQEIRSIRSNDGTEELVFGVDNFDVQTGAWPYEDQSFDTVLCCEILEHLHSDPMHVLSEINRILKPQGTLLITTPNIAGGHALEFCLRGDSPYVYGKFEQNGAPTDRHNREYTASEVHALAEAAGFECLQLRTMNSWWSYSSEILRNLVLHGFPIAKRGDNTFLLARKRSDVCDRYPAAFYQSIGIQSPRRSVQAEAHASHADTEAPMSPSRNILLLHEVLPHHDSSGADLRFFDVIRELRIAGHRVTYFARNGKNAPRYRADLEAIGVTVAVDQTEPGEPPDNTPVSALPGLLRQNTFDIAIFFHWFWAGMSVVEEYLRTVREISPTSRIIVLSDDRHGERERRAASLSERFCDFERGNSFEDREREAYAQADLVLYIAESDKDCFLRLVPNLETMHLPLAVDVSAATNDLTDRSGALFLGNFENLANADALRWLISEVWPLVLGEEPNLSLYVAGHGISTDALRDHKNIVSLGKVDDLSTLFDVRRLFVSPVRYGTGINTKNLQALSRGLPLVTTSIGAEGLQLKDNVHALISDSAEAFAASIVRLHRDNNLWTSLTAAGVEFARQNFSRAKLRNQLEQIMRRVMEVKPKSGQLPVWSYREIEKTSAVGLDQTLPRYQSMRRALNYWILGRKYMDTDDFRAALRQFRHVFTLQRGDIPKTVFDRAVLHDMNQCYAALADHDGQKRCKQVWQKVGSPRPLGPVPVRHRDPQISVVFPTYNRCRLLATTLGAWAFQTLPADNWELIVVDDGSDDGTDRLCQSLKLPYRFRYFRQENAGAGAARQLGTKMAEGDLLLLCNDDTIPDSQLLNEHLLLHRQSKGKNNAILGKFSASDESIKRALSFFVNRSPFFFPQATLQPGQILDQAYFVTCNLSVRRDLVLAAGNFDPEFRVAEDTELGARLARRGTRVVYHPSAHADHEHGTFTTSDLIRRAKAYGRADWALFKKHSWLLGDGGSPFGKLTESDIQSIIQRVGRDQAAVTAAVDALSALDSIDFIPVLNKQDREAALGIQAQLARLVPMVYWHYLLQSFLECRSEELHPINHTLEQHNAQPVGPLQ
jgi:O-antigen biosynthesis protein